MSGATLKLYVLVGYIADSVTDFLLGRPGSWLASIWHSQFNRSSYPRLVSWLWSVRQSHSPPLAGDPTMLLGWSITRARYMCCPLYLGSQMVGLFFSEQLLKVTVTTFESPVISFSCLCVYLPPGYCWRYVPVSFCCVGASSLTGCWISAAKG